MYNPVKCKKCDIEFEKYTGSENNPDFCSDDCNYQYHEENTFCDEDDER